MEGCPRRVMAPNPDHRCPGEADLLLGICGWQARRSEEPAARGYRLYFGPQYPEFSPRNMWSLSNEFTSAFKKLDPVPQFKATAKLGAFLSHGSCNEPFIEFKSKIR